MFTRHRIQLIGDRTSGAEFPEIRGKFLLIEKSDIPCEVAFDSPTVFIPAREGMDHRGPFKSIHVRHPIYTVSVGLDDSARGLPELRLISSDDSALNNYYSESEFPGCLPYDGQAWPIRVGIGAQIRAIKINAYAETFTIANILTPISQGYLPRLIVSFTRDFDSNIVIAGMGYTKSVNSFGYSAGPGNTFTFRGVYLPLDSTVGGAVFDTPWIPVPSGASGAYLTIQCDGLAGSALPRAFNGDNSSTLAVQAK
jgi:hypothetical protein